jgi:hypothetical protein
MERKDEKTIKTKEKSPDWFEVVCFALSRVLKGRLLSTIPFLKINRTALGLHLEPRSNCGSSG